MLEEANNHKKATIFEFLGRQISPQSGELVFTYRQHFADAEPLDFTETITVSDQHDLATFSATFTEAILEDLHLILGISYYKLFCSPEFKTDIKLSENQTTFWNTIYTKGLSEFIYTNKLTQVDMAQFSATLDYKREISSIPTDLKKILIGIGGGKDSIVALELLKDYDRTGFILETGKEYPLARQVCTVADVKSATIKRTLDPQIYAGVPGAYNGHLPISVIYAFLGVLEAALQGQAFIVVGNEYSSSFGTIVENGEEVNHQWSKSEEFEKLFQSYVATNLTKDVRYFSLLRPFFEIRIVEMFTKLGSKYFETFSSCNRNFAKVGAENNRWCCECPKCAFGFLLLSAFLPPTELLKIFPRNLYEDETLIPLFKDLLGFGTMKPFDCVGTFEESQVALSLAKKEWGNTLVLQALVPLLTDVSLSTEVFRVQRAPTVPTQFRLLGMQSVLLLGYAREGKASEAFLQKYHPDILIGIADQADGPDYLLRQEDFDLVIKTAGIPNRFVSRQYTTATNIFFSLVGKEQIIGVTGSKGKSTTATLIYKMFETAGKSARLIGNIGKPALESLLDKAIEPDELCVFELSSYQLEDLDVSPHVAVVTSLFPEHLDYHGSLELYYSAKQNIVRFQNQADFFFYTPGFPDITAWTKGYVGQSVTPDPWTSPIENKSLRGDHMKANVAAAFKAASHFGVTEAEAATVVQEFVGLPHRLMHVGTFAEIEFYDDSISTTPESAIAAIKALQNVDTIILGGVDRGYNFSQLEAILKEYGVRNIVLFPDSGTEMLASEAGFNVLHTDSMPEAVTFAYTHTEKGKSCVLSPAAPSYNLFKNFEERGESFIKEVMSLAK